MLTLPADIPDKLTLRDIGCRAVRVPLVFTLGTSAAIIRAVPFLLVDLSTEEGPVGRTYVFCYTGSGARAIAEHIREAAELVRQQTLMGAKPEPGSSGLRRMKLMRLSTGGPSAVEGGRIPGNRGVLGDPLGPLR